MKKYFILILCLLSLKCSRNTENDSVEKERKGGLIEDKASEIDKVPVIASKNFQTIQYRGKPAANNDDDKDGIINKKDLCPNEPETYNGYLDTDGCPDEIVIIPPPPPPPASGVHITMPPAGNQGSEGSCVAFSVGYATRSVEYFYQTNASTYNNSTNIFSPEFLYNQVKASSDCGSGTTILKTLDFLVAKGICTFQTMPYSSANGCSLMPTSAQLTEALNYKINGYSKVINTDRTAIKALIQQNHPLIIMILADNSFISASAGFIWKSYSGSGMLAHSIAIVGYDDTKNAYKVMNSWGTGWGDAGHSWIDYDFFETGGKTSTYCYVITP